jgi:hypothetical protein
MIKRRKALHVGAALVAAAIYFGVVSPASATLTLTLTDVGTGATTGPLTDLGTGQITFNAALGNFTSNVTTALGQPKAPVPGTLDLNSVNSASKADTLVILVVETGASIGATSGTGLATSLIGGTIAPTGSSLVAKSWYDANNVGGVGVGTLIMNSTFPDGAFSGKATAGVSLKSPFALTEQVTITYAGPGTTSFDFSTDVVVPAPAGLVLALTGLPCMVAGAWIRRRKAKIA